MDAPATGSDVGGELDDLRRRAYGPHPDIEDDPAALARLIELEAAQHPSPRPRAVVAAPLAEVTQPAPAAAVILSAENPASSAENPPFPPGETRPAPRRRWALGALIVGTAIALTGVVIAGVVGFPRPPDAVMRPTGAEPDDQLLTLLAAEGQPLRPDIEGASEMQIDLSTLHAFGTYSDIEVWSAVNTFGSPCLIGVHRATDDVVARRCMPAGADLFMDMPWDVLHENAVRRALPEGQVLRFFLRPDAVDVHVLGSEGGAP
ncbi:hypothetical protein ACFC1I_02135 [Microbacterium sp. NPDC056044]|uniref:hypothetical protein n=1 Tax=Microbacterium sp. NPDC056044 TaxID=3345690 RepID=UPI0035D52BFB